MSKIPVGTCPNPREFEKFWRSRANKNAEALQEQGRPLRAINFTVTEDQANRRFHLAPSGFKPGEVLARLQACNIPCVDAKPGDYLLAWNPKAFDLSKPTPHNQS